MPRQKLSEYRSKQIVSAALGIAYQGWSIDVSMPLDDQLNQIQSVDGNFVVKVDEGVKKRFKNGLVNLNVTRADLKNSIESLAAKGYRWIIVEPMVEHSQDSERYISITSDRSGPTIQFTSLGGVDVEEHAKDINSQLLNSLTDWNKLASETNISENQLRKLLDAFNTNYFTLLEINPYLVEAEKISLLDTAVEVDDAAAYFVESWNISDFRRHKDQKITQQELISEELDEKSPASFKLSVLNPDGGIFLLLSGGGASVVVADEIYNQKFGPMLANYGEYSGNPNTEETYTYTKAVLDLLIESKATRKVLFIGGAVANFTDIAKTFKGVVQALIEVADELKKQNVRVFVRRGGPNQESGLALMKGNLEKLGLLGAVHDPSTPITVAVSEALKEISNG